MCSGSEAEIGFAGLRFRISGFSESQAQTFTERFNGPADTRIAARRQIPVEIERADIGIPEMSRLLAPNGEYMPAIEHAGDGVRVQGHDFAGRIRMRPDLSGRLFVRRDEDLEFPVVENFLRVLTAYAVLEQGGLFLHSASVVRAGTATLFLGRSGAGKSTISRLALASGAAVLSDDANILMPAAGGGYAAAQVPFAGELGQEVNAGGGPVKVSAIFWLDRHSSPGVRPLDPALQIARLMACASVANVDPEKFDRLQAVMDDILRELPVRTLGFDRDSDYGQLHAMMEETEPCPGPTQ